MYKIHVYVPEKPDFQYFTTVVPITGDRMMVEGTYYKVIERCLIVDNQNFIMIKLDKECTT